MTNAEGTRGAQQGGRVNARYADARFAVVPPAFTTNHGNHGVSAGSAGLGRLL
jgi:hypothetical protein